MFPHEVSKEAWQTQLFARLEVLRGILAFYVLISHSRGHLYAGLGHNSANIPASPPLYHYINGLTALGQEAVYTFFVLSGFSIAYSVRHSKSWTAFWMRRLIRIYPPFLCGLIIGLITSIILYYYRESPWSQRYNYEALLSIDNWPYFLSYSADAEPIAQYWSLRFEAFFYIFAPFLLMGGWKPYVKLSLVGSTCLLFTTRGAVNDSFLLSFVMYNLYFATGAVIYGLYVERDSFRFKVSALLRRYRLAVLLGITTCLVLLLAVRLLKITIGPYSAANILCIPLSIMLLLVFSSFDLRTRILTGLGRRSYSMYVSHLAAILASEALFYEIIGINYPTTQPFFWIAGVPIALVASELTYQLSERPSLQLLARYRSGSTLAPPVRWKRVVRDDQG
jgi:peptidoglycan/LPS O-acetylase OafA/YrhL